MIRLFSVSNYLIDAGSMLTQKIYINHLEMPIEIVSMLNFIICRRKLGFTGAGWGALAPYFLRTSNVEKTSVLKIILLASQPPSFLFGGAVAETCW